MTGTAPDSLASSARGGTNIGFEGADLDLCSISCAARLGRMSDPILADQVRAFAFERFVKLAGTSEEIRIRAGDVHRGLQFADRVPLVVAALRARRFQEQYGLDLVGVEGQPVSTTTTFIFRRTPSVVLTAPAPAVAWGEVTSLEHGHGGLGWELGRWLWSPTTSRDGAERYGIMEQPQPGDQVFHLVAGVASTEPRRRVLFGVSRVVSAAERTSTKPPLVGAWGEAEAYFRIGLADFTELAVKPPMEEVEAELEDVILADLAERPKYYPYAPYRDGFRGAQGIYLTKLSRSLAEALREVAGVSASPAGGADSAAPSQAAREFAEGERSRRESAFFKRNPALRAAAIAKHGVRCRGCDHSLGEIYGELGAGYIEIHHLDPLAERADGLSAGPHQTTVDDVTPLCANCHRMVHRRRPALSIDELRRAMASVAGGRRS